MRCHLSHALLVACLLGVLFAFPSVLGTGFSESHRATKRMEDDFGKERDC